MNKKSMKTLTDLSIKKCTKCKGLNIPGETENAPGYGDINSPIMIIGQSLCTVCMKTQIPFTGGSGLVLDKIFHLARVKKEHLFITNLVHCHPPNNRPSKLEEIKNCREHLFEEIKLVNPLLIIGLGKEVQNNLAPNLTLPINTCFYHANGIFKGRSTCYVYHPSYIFRLGGVNYNVGKNYIELMVNLIRRFV